MMPMLSRRSSCAAAWAGALILAIAVWGAPGARSAAETGDEAFIQLLETADPDTAVDRTRLSRLFFGFSATLEGGKSSVLLLGSGVPVRDPGRKSVRRLVEARFSDYAKALERFDVSTSLLLDDPGSGAALFHALVDGHRSCWQLDAFTQLVESYGARSQDLMSILSSIEACARFRRVAYTPAVEEAVSRELEEVGRLRTQVRELTAELEELERLLEDLRRIESAD
jgi:hypothetical protein